MLVGLINYDISLMTRVLLELCWHREDRLGFKELQWEDAATPSRSFMDIPRVRNQDLYISKMNLLDLSGTSSKYEERDLTLGVGSTHMHTQTCPFPSISILLWWCILFNGKHLLSGQWKCQVGVLSSALMKEKKKKR